jgi:diaminopimelate epimerase
MRFAKYHGLGNDFIMLADPDDAVELDADAVVRMCDRRFGIGADGVIRVGTGRRGAEFFMDYVNSDGSVGEMCGNGIRCVALFARDEGLSSSNPLLVDTRAGIKELSVEGDHVRVDMGPPIFAPGAIPVHWSGSDALHMKLETDTGIVEAASLSMGNPHAVLFVDEPNDVALAEVGPLLEKNRAFPNGANIEFTAVESPTEIRVRVWERGAGQTLACGTGACAAAVAAVLLGGAEAVVRVQLPGGTLEIEWNGSLEKEAPVYMTGPATHSFSGEIDLDALEGAGRVGRGNPPD